MTVHEGPRGRNVANRGSRQTVTNQRFDFRVTGLPYAFGRRFAERCPQHPRVARHCPRLYIRNLNAIEPKTSTPRKTNTSIRDVGRFAQHEVYVDGTGIPNIFKKPAFTRGDLRANVGDSGARKGDHDAVGNDTALAIADAITHAGTIALGFKAGYFAGRPHGQLCGESGRHLVEPSGQMLRTGACDVIGLGRPLCGDPDGPRRELLTPGGGGATLPRYERELTPGVWWLRWLIAGVGKVSGFVQTVVGFSKQTWYYAQIFEMAEHGEPNVAHGCFAALKRNMQHEKKCARALVGVDCVGSEYHGYKGGISRESKL